MTHYMTIVTGLSMDKLESLGCVRFALSVVASSMHEALQQPQHQMPRGTRELWGQARTMCEMWTMQGARLVQKRSNTLLKGLI